MEISYRHRRAEALLHKVISRYVEEESNRKSFVTITRVFLNKAGTIADVWYSVFPTDNQGSTDSFLKRHTQSCREYIKSNSRLKIIPAVRFHIDDGEKHREKIDRLSEQI